MSSSKTSIPFQKNNDRFYPINGKEYVSVTTVLSVLRKEGLEYWRGKVGNEKADQISNEAKDTGKLVHEILERHLKGEQIVSESYPIPIRKCLSAFRVWEKKNKFKVLKTEQLVWSDKYEYAGTFDALGTLDGKLTIIDFKTSKQIWPDYGLQLSAYKFAEEERAKDYATKSKISWASAAPIEQQLIVRLDKETGVLETQEFNDDFEVFLGALKLWKWKNENVNPLMQWVRPSEVSLKENSEENKEA